VTTPLILWAGRLDRQKRFDLFLDIARAMPDVTFWAWGKEVLDARPDLSAMPSNVTLHEPFKLYDELPLESCDGWLFTSAWEGLPTLVVELAAFGVPIVASAVGGVGELIDSETGWLIEDIDDAGAYVAALRDLITNRERRAERAAAAQARARARHTFPHYTASLQAMLAAEDADD
jgi:glycosyltransferase involved in cell wall biosynthesis